MGTTIKLGIVKGEMPQWRINIINRISKLPFLCLQKYVHIKVRIFLPSKYTN